MEHRLEFVRELNGVAWYNDSKATNVDATLKAIDAFAGGLWIILGGKDKNSDYTAAGRAAAGKAHAALLIGAAAEKISAHLDGAVPLIACGTLEAAVQEARARARAGDTVLLAPACASFDQFENYEHRGREFKRLVRELAMAKLKTDWILFLTILAMVGVRAGDAVQRVERGGGVALRRTALLFRACGNWLWAIGSFFVLMYFKRLRLSAAEHAGMGIFGIGDRAGAAGGGVFRRPARAPLVPDQRASDRSSRRSSRNRR